METRKRKFFLLDMVFDIVPNVNKNYDLGDNDTQRLIDQYFVSNLMLDEYDFANLVKKSYMDGTIPEGSYNSKCKDITPIKYRTIQEHTPEDLHIIRYYDRTFLHFVVDINNVWYSKEYRFVLDNKPWFCEDFIFDSLQRVADYIKTKRKVVIHNLHVCENGRVEMKMVVIKN